MRLFIGIFYIVYNLKKSKVIYKKLISFFPLQKILFCGINIVVEGNNTKNQLHFDN